MNRRTLPGHIAVVGGGPVARAAAAAFAQAMPGVRVTLVPAPVPEAALADRRPLALPCAHAMLARLGGDPARLVAHGVARPRVATRFLDWSIDGTPWLVADEPLPAGPGVALHQLWLRADTPLPLHALHPACVAAEHGHGTAGAETALHLDSHRLGEGLASLGRQAGVMVASAPLAQTRPDATGVDTLRLADGAIVRADLFVDATGPDRRLATARDFEDWHAHLPCDRLAIEPALAAPSPVDSYRATPGGWVAHWPGATVTAGIGDDAGRDAIRFAPGRLLHPLRGNVLALGEAAVQPGPLGLAGFTLALAQIDLALELLPLDPGLPLLAAEYNRRAGQRADRMRDFLALHYHGGGRSCFGPVPPSIDAILGPFRRRATLPPADEDSVDRDAWIAMLLGQGLRPQRPDPIALGIPRAIARRAVLDLARSLAAPRKPRP